MICGGYVTVIIPRISNCSSQGTLCKILAAHEIKPHKVKYYLQNRDPEFAEKMAEVLEVYREVETLKVAARAQKGDAPAVAIISCHENLGIQALATTAPDLPPELKVHETFARDQEYVRRRTMSLLAGLDLVTGVVHARVEERHRSREFADLLKQIDAAHAPAIAIKLLVDNHSSHKSKETRAWLGKQPKGRLAFTFLPKHGSWLNLIEGFFSKLARSVLRHIRVADKQELKQRILAQIDRINRNPVVHKWAYKLKGVA
jgi:transposase